MATERSRQEARQMSVLETTTPGPRSEHEFQESLHREISDLSNIQMTDNIQGFDASGILGGTNYFNLNNSSVNIISEGSRHRPFETAVLSTKQLLDNVDWRNFVKTRAYNEARNRLKQLKVVIMVGRQGSGKTTTARYILKSLFQKGHPLILSDPSEWDLIPGSPEKFVNVLIDDIFGFDHINPVLKDMWLQKVDFIYNLAMYGQVCVMIVLRTDIYNQCKEQLSRFKLFSQASLMSLADARYQLTSEEMFEMAKRYMKQSRSDPDVKEVQLNLQGLASISFPQICAFYAANQRAQARGLGYWQNPVECIIDELKLLKEQQDIKYFILVLVMTLKGRLPQMIFYRNEEGESDENLSVLKSVRKFIPFNIDQTTNLETIANSMVGVFLTFSQKDKTYRFIHPVVHDALLLSLKEFHIKDIIDICPTSFLFSYVKTSSYPRAENTLALHVKVQDSIHLARRIAVELTKGDYLSILNHEALKDKLFVKCLTEKVLKHEGCIKISKRRVGFFTIYKEAYYCFAGDLVFRIPDASTSPQFIKTKQWVCNYKSLLCMIAIHQLEYLTNTITKQIVDFFENQNQRDCASRINTEDIHYFDRRLLLCSCFMGFHETAKILLQNHQAVMFSSDIRHIVCATIASENESTKLMKLLLKILTNVCNFYGTHGTREYLISVVRYAARLSVVHLKVRYLDQLLKCLRQHEKYLDVISDLIHQILVEFRTFIWYGANLSKPLCSNKQCIVIEMLKMLLQAGVPNCPGKMIFLAAQHQTSVPLDLLLNKVTYEEYVTGENSELWKQSFDGISWQTPKGRTALMEAADRCIDSVKLLLTLNANISVIDEGGYTLLHSKLIYSDVGVLQEVLGRLQVNICDLSYFCNDRKTPLHVASEHGDMECFLLLLERNVDINAQTGDGFTVLHKAIVSEFDQFEILNVLLNKGAKVNLKDTKGNTALHLAARESKRDIVSKLIEHGANVNLENNEGNTALHIALSPLFSKECTELLIRKGANVLCANKTGVTPLCQAALSSSVEVLSLCLEKCSGDIVCKSHLNPHPLVASPDIEKIQLLVKHGFCGTAENSQNCLIALAKAEYPNPKYKPFNTKPIYDYATLRRLMKTYEPIKTTLTLQDHWFEETVRLMCEMGACVNRLGPDGCTLLQVSMKSSNIRMVETLLQAGADPNIRTENETDILYSYRCLVKLTQDYAMIKLLMDNGWQPDVGGSENSLLPDVAAHRYWKTLALLLKNGCEINAKSSFGESSLHASINSWKCLKVLLQYNVNVDSQDRDGNTVLHRMATEQKCRGKIKLMLKNKANPNICNKKGDTPLLTACRNSCNLNEKEFKKCTVKKEIKDGDTITTYKTKGNAVLSKMNSNYCNSIIKVLLANKATADVKDKYGEAALHIAVKASNYKLLRVLLSGGCSSNVTDSHANTPLNLLLRNQLKVSDSEDFDAIASLEKIDFIDKHTVLRFVKELLDHHTDPNIGNKYGDMPLHYAVMTDCLPIVELLLGAEADADAEDNQNRTPLHRLAHCGHTTIARVLLDNGCDVDATDITGDTALHIAVRKRKYNLVKLLVEKGADLNKKNEDENTGFDLCRELEHCTKPCWWVYKGHKLLKLLDPTQDR